MGYDLHITRKDYWANPDGLQITLDEVYTKNPDDAIIRKSVAIAKRLDARVVGDDDEEYS